MLVSIDYRFGVQGLHDRDARDRLALTEGEGADPERRRA